MATIKNFLMYKLFGFCPGQHCKTCSHLIRYTPSDRSFYKCECYGITSSEATDWRVGSPACGLHNKPYNGRPVVRTVVPQRKEEAQIAGQMNIMDFM